MKDLDGKTALVTGAGESVGRAVALALAARGVRVVVFGPDERALGETVGEIAHGGGKARHVVGDVRDPAHVTAAALRAIDTFGALDIAVVDAAAAGPAELGRDLDAADAILRTNLLGVYYTFDAAARRMGGPGRLLAVCRAGASVAGTASEAGIAGLVRSAAHELGAREVTCNAVVVGSAMDGREEQVAELVVFLCSRGAVAVSGQAIAIG